MYHEFTLRGHLYLSDKGVKRGRALRIRWVFTYPARAVLYQILTLRGHTFFWQQNLTQQMKIFQYDVLQRAVDLENKQMIKGSNGHGVIRL